MGYSKLIEILDSLMGSGKTLTTTAFTVLDFMTTGKRVIANYRIDLERINDEGFMREVIMPRWKILYAGKEIGTIKACHDKSAISKTVAELRVRNPQIDPALIAVQQLDDYFEIGASFVYLDYQRFVTSMEENKELYSVSLAIDEAYLWADSRLSQTQYSRLLTYFVLQSRKRDVDLYITTQQFENVDIRLRRNCEVRILCRNNKKTGVVTDRILDLRTGLRRRVRIFGPDIYRFYNTLEIPPLQAMHTRIEVGSGVGGS